MKVLRGVFAASKFSNDMKRYYEKEGAEFIHTMYGKTPVVMVYGNRISIETADRKFKSYC